MKNKKKWQLEHSDLRIFHKTSLNLSVQVAIFKIFHNPFIMLFHIFRSVLDHELKSDNFLILSMVTIVFSVSVHLK